MKHLSWLAILRLGLVQTALGAVVVLTTSTLNRVMKIELALPALLPGLLVGLHSALQLSRPLWGHVADGSQRRSRWIIVGMVILALGGTSAAHATAVMQDHLVTGVAYAIVAYTLVGFGVGAAGTSLLALLAARVAPGRRAAAASIVWLMMIAGFIVTTAVAGALLEPFSFTRLVEVCAGVSVAAVVVAGLALVGVEGRAPAVEPSAGADRPSFREALAEVWADGQARAFTIFVFVAMLAYNTQDLILEPFAGAVFGLTPGASTQLTSVQHSGVLLGMIVVALAASEDIGPRIGSLKTWTVGGCVGSGLALALLATAGWWEASPDVLRAAVALLGFANGAFAVAAIGWMMALAGAGRGRAKEGIRMGLWGGAQAIAFGLGAFVGTLGVDVVTLLTTSAATPYAAVFVAEGLTFLVAARLAADMRFEVRSRPKGSQGAMAMFAASMSPEDAPLASPEPVPVRSTIPPPRGAFSEEGVRHEPIHRRPL